MTAPAGRIEPRSDTFHSGSLTLRYVDWGGEASTPMVLLHGFSSQARYWDGFAVHARHRYRVYGLDQRGHGQSDWADDYSADTMPGDVEALAEHLGLDRFVLVGHSMGGLVAMRYTLADGTVTYRFDPEVLPKLLPASEEGRRRNAAALADQIERSRSVGCPMLLVRGEHSDIVSPAIATATVGMFPRGQMVEIPGTTHLVPTDDPRAFRTAVFAFLDAELPAHG